MRDILCTGLSHVARGTPNISGSLELYLVMLSFIARGALRQIQCPSALSGVGVDGGFLNLQLKTSCLSILPFFFFLTRPFPRNISRFQNVTMTFPLLKEREITNTNVVCTKCIYCRLFILFVLSRIKLV